MYSRNLDLCLLRSRNSGAKSQASGNFLNEGGGQVRFFVLRVNQRQRMHVLYVLVRIRGCMFSRSVTKLFMQQTVDSEKSM